MKESGGDRLKQAIQQKERGISNRRFTKAPYPPLTRSPFPDGEGKKEAASPHLLEDRLKCAVYESTLSTAARSPFPNGEGYDMGMPLSP